MSESFAPNETVRCVDCHALYRSEPVAKRGARPACPVCGGSAWLAAQIPVVALAFDPRRG